MDDGVRQTATCGGGRGRPVGRTTVPEAGTAGGSARPRTSSPAPTRDSQLARHVRSATTGKRRPRLEVGLAAVALVILTGTLLIRGWPEYGSGSGSLKVDSRRATLLPID
jgi:hypothetical protein